MTPAQLADQAAHVAQRATDLEAIEPRKHEIEHDEMRLALASELERPHAILRRRHVIPLALEIQRNRGPRFGVVLHEENAAAHPDIVRGGVKNS